MTSTEKTLKFINTELSNILNVLKTKDNMLNTESYRFKTKFKKHIM